MKTAVVLELLVFVRYEFLGVVFDDELLLLVLPPLFVEELEMNEPPAELLSIFLRTASARELGGGGPSTP